MSPKSSGLKTLPPHREQPGTGGRSGRAPGQIREPECAPGSKLVRSSRWKSGPSKGQRPLGSECCVVTGDSGCEAYTAIAWGVGLSLVRSDIAGAEGFHSLEGNMCGIVLQGMRAADALPGSKATSRAKGSYRNLGGLGPDRNGDAVVAPHREGENAARLRRMDGPDLHGKPAPRRMSFSSSVDHARLLSALIMAITSTCLLP